MVYSDKKIRQKKRMVEYFLDAALQIINEEGYDKVTVRKVADIAGYNAATLYNYFDNLDHLLFFAAMKYLNEYIEALPDFVKHLNNSIEIYIAVWHCFIEYSFMRPEIYYHLFFSSLKNKMNEYTVKYYELFPIDIKHYPNSVRIMLRSTDISTRSKSLMDACIEEGLISYKNGYLIDDLVLMIYESMLMRVYLKSVEAGVAKEFLLQYIRIFFKKLRD